MYDRDTQYHSWSAMSKFLELIGENEQWRKAAERMYYVFLLQYADTELLTQKATEDKGKILEIVNIIKSKKVSMNKGKKK